MAAGRMVIAGWMPALDVNGLPIPNAQMYFYANNTTDLATVYANQALTIPLANPVLANSSGQFPEIWADDANLFSVTIDAPYGPPGQPFSFNNIGPATSANSSATNKADRDGSNIEVPPFRAALGVGTAALVNVGTAADQIPVLGIDGKFPSSVLPENGSYQGSWDASTNVPEIVSGVGNNGDFYYVSVAGTTVIDGYPADPMTQQWEIGDQIRFSSISGTWERIPDAGAANKADVTGDNINVPSFRTKLEIADIPSVAALQAATAGDVPFAYYRTAGFSGAGQYGSALLKYIGETDPEHGGAFSTDDGKWYEIVPELEVTPEQFGAVGDGVTDDTDAFTNIATFAEALGPVTVRLRQDANYLIDSGDIRLPKRCAIVASGGFVGDSDGGRIRASTARPAITLNPSYTIRGWQSGVIEGFAVIRKGYTDATGLRDLIDKLALFSGTAMTYGDGSDNTINAGTDATIRSVTFFGFQWAVKADRFPRLRIVDCYGDCTNGISLDRMYDILWLDKVQFQPLLSTGVPGNIFERAITAATNSSGKIRITVATGGDDAATLNQLATGDMVIVNGSDAYRAAMPNAIGRWTVTKISNTVYELNGSTFAGSFVSGGVFTVDYASRRGTAFYINRCDAPVLTGCFSYGHDIVFDLGRTALCNFPLLYGCHIDAWPADPTNIGLRTGNVFGLEMSGGFTSSRGKAFVLGDWSGLPDTTGAQSSGFIHGVMIGGGRAKDGRRVEVQRGFWTFSACQNNSGTATWYFADTINEVIINGIWGIRPVMSYQSVTAARKISVDQFPGNGLTAQWSDGTASGGNARNSLAVDWQVARDTAVEVASGAYATLGGGAQNRAEASYSVIPGGRSADTKGRYGAHVFSSGAMTARGDIQTFEQLYRRFSVGAGVVGLGADNTSNEGIRTFDNETLVIDAQVSARQTDGTAGTVGDTAAWRFTVAVKRGSGAASTTMLGGSTINLAGNINQITAFSQTITPIAADTGLNALRCRLDLNSSTGVINIVGVGEANKTIQWAAHVKILENVA